MKLYLLEVSERASDLMFASSVSLSVIVFFLIAMSVALKILGGEETFKEPARLAYLGSVLLVVCTSLWVFLPA